MNDRDAERTSLPAAPTNQAGSQTKAGVSSVPQGCPIRGVE